MYGDDPGFEDAKGTSRTPRTTAPERERVSQRFHLDMNVPPLSASPDTPR
jgi:hypothetical protein